MVVLVTTEFVETVAAMKLCVIPLPIAAMVAVVMAELVVLVILIAVQNAER